MRRSLRNDVCFGRRGTIALIGILLAAVATYGKEADQPAQPPIRIDTKTLLVSVDATTCRWSAAVKGSGMQINDD